MRILIFSHYFAPEGNAPASRMSAMSSHWARQGHDVQVITCAPNVPNGVVYEGYRNRLFQRETIDGVQVTRVWTFLSANKGTVKRITNFLSYMVMALIASWFHRRPDVIIATSPQFFCGWAGLLASKLRSRRIPFVLEIRDLWPDSIVAVGAMNEGSRLLAILHRLEHWMYRAATHVVTVGNGYRQDLLAKGVDRSKISVIPNGVDKHLFQPAPPDSEIVRRYGLESRTSCAYIGTIGMAAGLEIMLSAAERLRQMGRNDIRLLAVGDGAEREALERKAREKDLDNLVFTGRLPKEEIPRVLASIDLCLVHLKACDLFQRVLPSKIFEMAAMEKPVILGVRGSAAELVEEAHAGICIEPEDTDDFVAGLCRLADSSDLRAQYGRAGRDFVLTHYDREVLAVKYLRVLDGILQRDFAEIYPVGDTSPVGRGTLLERRKAG